MSDCDEGVTEAGPACDGAAIRGLRACRKFLDGPDLGTDGPEIGVDGHPVTGERLEIVAPVPDDLATLVATVGLSV